MAVILIAHKIAVCSQNAIFAPKKRNSEYYSSFIPLYIKEITDLD